MILLAQINSLLALFQPFFAQETSEYPSSGSTTGGLIGGGLGLIVGIFLIVAMWKVFSKAGQPGWAAIILSIDMAKSFGKGAGFGVGIAFLGFIFLPILGFGSAQYQGPSAGK